MTRRAHHVGDIMITVPGTTPGQRRNRKKAEEAEWAERSGPVVTRRKDEDEGKDEEEEQ